MEGSSHPCSPPLPAGPKLTPPPRLMPSSKCANRNKKAKISTPSSAPPETRQTQSIEYELVGMLVGRERFPEDIKKIKVTLSVPSPDDECPIALEPISSAELSFLPGCPFMQDSPEHTKMTLPCGHSFSAMVIVYSWCKSEMICPCCRQGVKRRANVSYLPAHFREQIRSHVASSLSTERAEDERESIQAFLSMSPITMSFTNLADEGCLEMTVGFFFRPANEEPMVNADLFSPSNQRHTSWRGHFSMMVRLTAQIERRGDRQMVAVFRPNNQNMSVLRQAPSDVRSINIVTQMRIPEAGYVEIDSSGEIDFPGPLPAPIGAQSAVSHAPLIVRRAFGYRAAGQPGGQSNLPLVPVSTFEISFGQHGSFVFLENITWIPDSSHIHVSVHRAL